MQPNFQRDELHLWLCRLLARLELRDRRLHFEPPKEHASSWQRPATPPGPYPDVQVHSALPSLVTWQLPCSPQTGWPLLSLHTLCSQSTPEYPLGQVQSPVVEAHVPPLAHWPAAQHV